MSLQLVEIRVIEKKVLAMGDTADAKKSENSNKTKGSVPPVMRE